MMLDPHADLGRRAWMACPSCATTPVYLLDCDINLIWLQCGTCLRRWWHDTQVGHPKTQSIGSTPPDHHATRQRHDRAPRRNTVGDRQLHKTSPPRTCTA